jgi:hypothetical protein
MTRSPSRWPAGTLAAAGTTPARTIEVSPALVISQGHHPAKHRSAIPARAYESGSGHGHDAAPAGHPYRPRPPPAHSLPHGSCPDRTIVGSGLPAPRAPAASLRERSAPLDPASPSHGGAAIRARTQIRTPANAHPAGDQNPETVSNHPRQLQSLDRPLHMSAQLQASLTTKTQVRSLRTRLEPKRGPTRVTETRRRRDVRTGGGLQAQSSHSRPPAASEGS